MVLSWLICLSVLSGQVLVHTSWLDSLTLQLLLPVILLAVRVTVPWAQWVIHKSIFSSIFVRRHKLTWIPLTSPVRALLTHLFAASISPDH
jgi:hypothetical protein